MSSIAKQFNNQQPLFKAIFTAAFEVNLLQTLPDYFQSDESLEARDEIAEMLNFYLSQKEEFNNTIDPQINKQDLIALYQVAVEAFLMLVEDNPCVISPEVYVVNLSGKYSIVDKESVMMTDHIADIAPVITNLKPWEDSFEIVQDDSRGFYIRIK